jgi:nucleoside-diphosphate-sugar epimerase
MRVFLAGATGAIGRALVPRLLAAGHDVTGFTRGEAGAARLRAAGARAVTGDLLDETAVRRAVAEARPEVVVHHATDLARALGLPPRQLARALEGTKRLRTTGTRHLAAAARESGAKRLVAQSVAFFYAPAPGLRTEADPLVRDGSLPLDSVEAVASLEREVSGTAYASDGPYAAMVRRRRLPIVGRGMGLTSFVHVEDAAVATVRALDAPPGVYNVVDDEPAALAEWLPAYAAILGAPPPRRVPYWLGRLIAGRYAAYLTTRAPGASNAKARLELGFAPRFASWRQGFREALG